MFGKLLKYIDELIENVLEFIMADGINCDEDDDLAETEQYNSYSKEVEYTEYSTQQIPAAKIEYIEYLQRKQETRTLVEALVKVAGITMEQLDSGNLTFEDYETE